MSGVKHPKTKKTKKSQPPKLIQDIVADYFEEIIELKENGVAREMTVFEAICTQLLIKAYHGDSIARRTLERYARYGRRRDPRNGVIVAVRNDDHSSEIGE